MMEGRKDRCKNLLDGQKNIETNLLV